MITAPKPQSLTSRPHARGYRDRVTVATVAPRTWEDMLAPDLTGLHLDRPGHHYAKRGAEAAMAILILLLAGVGLWLAVPHMTPLFLVTWTLLVVLYVVGRVSWDVIRRY